MYFVDRKLIEDKLQHLENIYKLFLSKEDWSGAYDQLAMERIVHIMLDAVLDVGNAMIDGFIMRDPGSYEDIIDILMDEKVIDAPMGENFKSLLPIRKELVQNYTTVNHEDVLHSVKVHMDGFAQYPVRIRTYLENELGAVSAFKPLDGE